jgi:hypothetical protein
MIDSSCSVLGGKSRIVLLTTQTQTTVKSACVKYLVSFSIDHEIAIIDGTDLVATDLIRQGLFSNDITSIVVVARKPTQLDTNAVNRSKAKSVVLRDYESLHIESMQNWLRPMSVSGEAETNLLLGWNRIDSV